MDLLSNLNGYGSRKMGEYRTLVTPPPSDRTENEKWRCASATTTATPSYCYSVLRMEDATGCYVELIPNYFKILQASPS